MIYLTYNDQPSGVYFSQVTDVCNYVNQQFNCGMRLVAFVSMRGFAGTRKKIKQHFPSAIVLPMVPKQQNWRLNKITLRFLFLFMGKQNIWSRGIFATSLALDLKEKDIVKKVVFDGRGAYEAEYKEYLHKIVTGTEAIADLEKRAVSQADHRLAVSKKLVEYWTENYNYLSAAHSVIPCTISNSGMHDFPSEEKLESIRKELGYSASDLVFIYSGSSADWQSLKMVDDFMLRQMKANNNVKLILLANTELNSLKTFNAFPQNVLRKWVKPSEVQMYLHAADYGILIREYAVTNEVASPTKFAEYLEAGLNVVISDKIGDFSRFTEMHNCGVVAKDLAGNYNFGKLAYSEKQRNHELAQQYFTKTAYKEEYRKIVDLLKSDN